MCLLEEIEETFVNAFPSSKSRRKLFNTYTTYVQDLQHAIQPESVIYQLMDGSFVTQKLNPRDIDIVSFIQFKTFERCEQSLRAFRKNGIYQNIDGFVEKVYPSDHPYYLRYQHDLVYWINLFSYSRKHQKKGLIKIRYGEAENH